MIVLSRSLVISAVQSYPANNPVIGWDNLATVDNVEAGTAATGFPASNLANANTSLEWRATDTADVYVTVTPNTAEQIDYLAVAKHNFGSGGATVSVEAQSEEGGAWVEVVQEQILADNSPVIFRFTPQYAFAVRLKIQPVATIPRAAVMYVGRLLVMERGLWVGHTPISYATRVSAIDGLAESGDYLGAIILGEFRESAANFQLISPAFYRASLWPFLKTATLERRPFFFAWRPSTYPAETGFARLINNPDPIPTDPSHLYEVSLQMRGIA